MILTCVPMNYSPSFTWHSIWGNLLPDVTLTQFYMAMSQFSYQLVISEVK